MVKKKGVKKPVAKSSEKVVSKGLESRNKLQGIGGWLLVYLIFLCISILSKLSSLSQIGNYISYPGFYIGGVVLLIFSILTLIYIMNKSKRTPTLVISFLWANVIIIFVEALYITNNLDLYLDVVLKDALVKATQNQPLLMETFKSTFVFTLFLTTVLLAVWALIWTLYFTKSKRVKNTFVK